MRNLFFVLSIMLCTIAFAQDEMNIKVETRGDDVASPDDNAVSPDDDVGSTADEAESPGVDIDIGVSEYPEMVPVPDYPVYYAPHANLNYFFYDGLYWVYWEDSWYASSWYRGPWRLAAPVEVPLFVLRVPVRYYRQPPVYFRSWRVDAPPRWGEHWGREWEVRRHGWDRWDHSRVPHIAPLPVYQRSYSGDRYPRAVEQRHSIRSEHYHYQPREAITQQHFQQQHNTSSSHVAPQLQAPVRQRSSNQHLKPMHQMQPVQPSPQLQHSHTTPQDRSRENKEQEHREDHR